MANQILTISMITQKALMILENNIVFTKNVYRGYDGEFGRNGAKIGDTLNIRKPARYIGRTGQALQLEDQTETSVPLQLNTQFGVDVSFTSKDLELSMDDFSDRYLKPAMAVVANKVDRDGLLMAKNNVGNAVGTPGTPPSTSTVFLAAGAKMDFEATPRDMMRRVVFDPNAQANLVDNLKGLFQSSTDIARQYEKGVMGTAFGFDFAMDQNVVQHTNGAFGGTPLVNLSGQSGSFLNTNGWTPGVTGLLRQGDIFTIAGVYAVNPQNRQTTGQLRQFVVQAGVNSDSSGNATIQISPAIVPPVSATIASQYQNVTAGPVNGAAITMFGAAGQITSCNMAYHKNAFTLGCADLPLPDGVDMKARVTDPQSGLSIRMVRAYDINNDRMPCRLDILYGWAPLYQETACQIRG